VACGFAARSNEGAGAAGTVSLRDTAGDEWVPTDYMYGSGLPRSVNRFLEQATTVVRGVVNGARSDRITFIAASLAFYALVSLLPLLVLALAAAAAFGDPGTVAVLVERASGALGQEAGSLVRDALTGAVAGGITLLGLVVLLWSALKLFRGLDIAFSEVYGRPGPDSLAEQLRNGSVALGAVVVGAAGTVVVGAVVAGLGLPPALRDDTVVAVAGTVGLVVGLVATFLPLYSLLPGGDVSVREALPGAVVAAVGWTLLQTGFRLYAAEAATYETYGVLGGMLLLVTFLYVGAFILLVGVVLNAVLAGRVDPDTGLAEVNAPTPEPTAVLEGTMTRDHPDDPSDEQLREQLEDLYDELDRFERRIDDRTVHRDDIERDLKRYVRRQVRRGKASGWGPYLVLMYGTVMTLGTVFYLSGGWAILAMLVIWLSTLGLYAVMLIVGTTTTIAGVPFRLRERFGD
jgi:YihY family inner membrane protein